MHLCEMNRKQETCREPMLSLFPPTKYHKMGMSRTHSQLTSICQYMPAMIRVTTVPMIFFLGWANLRYPARNSFQGPDSSSFMQITKTWG